MLLTIVISAMKRLHFFSIRNRVLFYVRNNLVRINLYDFQITAIVLMRIIKAANLLYKLENQNNVMEMEI